MPLLQELAGHHYALDLGCALVALGVVDAWPVSQVDALSVEALSAPAQHIFLEPNPNCWPLRRRMRFT